MDAAYEAIITDLDGTAVAVSSDGSDVSEADIAAVRRAQNNGCKIACATGRPWGSQRWLLKH